MLTVDGNVWLYVYTFAGVYVSNFIIFNLYFTVWPIPEVAVTVFSASDDGCCDTRNM